MTREDTRMALSGPGERDEDPMHEEQTVLILPEADDKAVPEVARKHGVSAQTIYAWRKHYGTLAPA